MSKLSHYDDAGRAHMVDVSAKAANARANCYAVLPDGKDLRVGDVIAVLLR